MLYLKKVLFVLTAFAGMQMSGYDSAYAWPLVDYTVADAWGVGSGDWNRYPTGVNYEQFCIGNSWTGSGCRKLMGCYGDDEAMVGLVAWQITANGGYFCTTQFQCEGKNKSWTWNLWPNGTGKCFWLCKNGYSGEGCRPINDKEYVLSSGDAACSSSTIERKDFSGNTVRANCDTGWNVENSIQLLRSAYPRQERDIMLGVAGWLDNKRGVVASPFLFWCSNRSHSNTFDINFFPQYKSEKLCLPGFTGENCERCKPTKMCDGYSLNDYDSAKHTMSLKNGCTVFRCSEGNGFSSSTKRGECIECSGQSGVDDDGVCVKCPTGQIFDKSTKACRQALFLSHTGMRYGAGKTSEPENVLDSCWTKENWIQYDCCIRNKTWNDETQKCE